MCHAWILATPKFMKTFIVECDASWNVIAVVLMQEGRAINFESFPIRGKYLCKPLYEKEMLVILHALKQWRPYVMGIHIKIKTYYSSFKYFLEQILSSEENKNESQICWVMTLK